MPIPTGSYYQKKALGNGTVSTIEGNTVNVVTAGEEIGFGCAVDIKNGKAVVATKAPIFGIAIKRDWTDAEHYFTNDVQNEINTTSSKMDEAFLNNFGGANDTYEYEKALEEKRLKEAGQQSSDPSKMTNH